VNPLPLHPIPQVDQLLSALVVAARDKSLSKHLKFGQLLMAVANQLGAGLEPAQLERLIQAAGSTDTFMTKAVKAKLARLQQAAT